MPQDDVTLLEGERRVLEMVATGASLRETLEALATLIEAQERGLRCGVLVLAVDGAYFSESYGPSLPATYHDAFAGLPITPPYAGACGEAEHRGEPVVVPNIAEVTCYTDQWRELLASFGLASLCSIPITAPDGTVLGSFAMYYGHPRDPRPADPRLTEIATHLAAIALERARNWKLAAARDARLEASAKQFADLIENAPFGTYAVDTDFRLAQASQSARTAFGIDGLIGMDLGDALRKMWPGPFASDAIARFRHTLATGEPYTAKDTVERRADIDAVEAYDWRIQRIVMPDGRFGIVCYFYDLSERQRMEAELRASEARFARAFEQAPSFMAMLSGPEHVIEIANPGYLKLVGNRDVVGRAIADALPDAAAQGYLDLLDRVYRTGTAFAAKGAKYEVQPIPGGPVDERFVDFVYQPITDASGAVTRIFVEGFDVTDRITAEAQWRESEERLRLATEAADIGWWDVEEGHGRLSWPPRVKAMFGISADAPVSMDDFYNGLHPDDRDRVAAAYVGAADPGRRELYDVEYRTIGKEDGIVRWVAAKGRGVFDETGRCKRVIGTAIDISERKLAQEEKLAREKEDAKLREQFIAVLGHDLRNPLASVAAGIQVLMRRPERAPEIAAQIDRSISRMSELIENVLDFARGRLGGGFVTTRDSEKPLEPVLLHVIEELRSVHPKRSVVVDIDLREPVECDRQRIGQLLSNLLGNALVYGAPTAPILVHAQADGGQFKLSVTNSGEAIEPSALERLFQPFFRGTVRDSRVGLGLALQLLSSWTSESMGNHDSNVVDATSVN
jgi:PAS domain S-box-containing protein